MSEADQHEPNQNSAADAQSAGSGEGPPISRFEVVPTRQTNMPELYTFREALAPPPGELVRAQKKSPPVPIAGILMTLAVLALVAFLIFAIPTLLQPKPPLPYIDMGSQRFDPAGLSGRLIARWQSSGSYELFLDPIDQGQVARFAAMALDPPRQLSITLRFRDDAGLVTCQKSILLPSPVPHEPGTKYIPPPGQQQTQTGDTAQNMTGEDGQIAEIDLTGPLPCPAKVYTAFKTWDFFTDFPTVAEQDEWLRQEKGLDAKAHGNKNQLSSPIQRLPTAIEGDDVIVADNPTRGTVETSGGRVFFLGVAGMHTRATAWQVFPASVHFRCDKNGSCVLTRTNSHVSLQARLLK